MTFPCAVAFFVLGILILQCFENHWSFSGRQHKDWSKYYIETIILGMHHHFKIQHSRLSKEKCQKRRIIMVNFKNVALFYLGPPVFDTGPGKGGVEEFGG